MSIHLLDCTFRDGGYVNDWSFSPSSYSIITEGLVKAGIEFVELGILGQPFTNEFSTRYWDLKGIHGPKEKGKTKFTVMGACPEMMKIQFPDAKNTVVDAVRVAFFKNTYMESLEFAKELKNNGYQIFIQAMATFLYNKDELREMLSVVNKVEPYAFYMVDSFGMMYEQDVKQMYQLVNQYLTSSVGIGFHGHNNSQMALANTITFLNCCEQDKREVFVDASLCGMGRGAGNTCLELIAHYLNVYCGGNYDEEEIERIGHSCILPLQDKYNWGYGDIWFLSAKERVNPAYVWFLNVLGVTEYEEIKRVLCKIPKDIRYSLDKEVVKKLVKEELGHE